MKNLDSKTLSKEDLISRIRIAQTGYGHWKLSADFYIYGEKIRLSAITTDSQLIDSMRNEDTSIHYGYEDVEKTAVEIIERCNYVEIVEHWSKNRVKYLKRKSAQATKKLI